MPLRIKPGSSFSNEMILDIALSKFCDLIPMERFVAMAIRQGFPGLAQNSLIETTHYLADFLVPIYKKLKATISQSVIIMADETPHRMLEGDKRTGWYLWSFSSIEVGCYLECHPSRSGDIAINFLKEAFECEALVCDDYSGYVRAVKEIKELRQEAGGEAFGTSFMQCPRTA